MHAQKVAHIKAITYDTLDPSPLVPWKLWNPEIFCSKHPLLGF